jgi:molybdenum cofactor guanylyltransferase
MTRRAGIILAGGKGERFQTKLGSWQDKVLAEIDGKPLLVQAIENVSKITDEVIVCVNDRSRKEKYTEVLDRYGITSANLVIDEKIDNLGGPLLAIFSGLKASSSNFCLTLPSDMPFASEKVIEYMFRKAKGTRVVVPMWPNGRLETLVMVLETSCALEIADTLCQLRRPRSDDLIRGALNVIFVSNSGEIRNLDPKLKSFININSPEDLACLQPRHVGGDFSKDLHINYGELPVHELKELRKASNLSRKEKHLEASKIFSKCALTLEKNKSYFWTAISQENEGKSLLNLTKQQNKLDPSSEEVIEARLAFMRAAKSYGLETELHQKCRCVFLAERAKSDRLWCESTAKKLR